jgi:DNA-binding MarR family transcriptional regulator
MSAATSITRAHQILLRRIDGTLEPLGLNFSRFEALALLHFSRAGSLPLGKIGDRLQVHPTSVTNTIDRLEADGLVTRRPHPNDRRTTLAGLTSRGRRRVQAAARALAEVDFGLDGMPSRDLNKVDEALTPLRRSAGDF